VTAGYFDAIRDIVLLPGPDAPRALGLAYHLADILVPELLAAASDAPPPAAALLALLAPFSDALAGMGEPAALDRVREAVFEALAEEVAAPSAGAPLRHLPVQPLATALFDAGGAEGLRARNRDALFKSSRALEKAARKRSKRDGSGTPAAAAAPSPAPARQAPTPKSAARCTAQRLRPAAGGGRRPAAARRRRRLASDGRAAQRSARFANAPAASSPAARPPAAAPGPTARAPCPSARSSRTGPSRP